jgi:adenosylhomocysteinase
MDRAQIICESIVQTLKRGLVPAHGLERLAVGRGAERRQLRRDLAFSKYGGGWVRWVSGDYGTGKTFLCSWTREEAWQEGFVVAAVDLGRDAPFHRFAVIYHRIMEGLRTEHFQDIPALEFILEQWFAHLEKKIQRSMGLDPLQPKHRAQIAMAVEQQIDVHLTNLRIYDPSLANALRGYYMAVPYGNDLVATGRRLTGSKGHPTSQRSSARSSISAIWLPMTRPGIFSERWLRSW